MDKTNKQRPPLLETGILTNITKKMDYPKYLTKNEAADLVRLTPTSITNYINSGRLKSYRIGGRVLIEKSDLAALIEEKIITKPITK